MESLKNVFANMCLRSLRLTWRPGFSLVADEIFVSVSQTNKSYPKLLQRISKVVVADNHLLKPINGNINLQYWCVFLCSPGWVLGNSLVVQDRMKASSFSATGLKLHSNTKVEWTAALCTIYLEHAWELKNYLGKFYCVSVYGTASKCELISQTRKE